MISEHRMRTTVHHHEDVGELEPFVLERFKVGPPIFSEVRKVLTKPRSPSSGRPGERDTLDELLAFDSCVSRYTRNTNGSVGSDVCQARGYAVELYTA